MLFRSILDNLGAAGVPKAELDNLEKALADLDYSMLRVQLSRGEEGADSALALLLEGTATSGGTTVPVNLNVTFHGDLDKLVNTGIDLSRRK